MGNVSRFRKIAFFIGAVAISLIASHYNFRDMVAKAKGELGGKAKPVIFHSGLTKYNVSAKIAVLPSINGDIKVELQGNPEIPYRLYNYRSPVIDLGLSHFYHLNGDILKDVKPGKKPISLRIFLYPPAVDPVCGMPYEKGFLSKRHGWKTYYFCSKDCLDEFNRAPERYRGRDGLKGEYAWVFNSVKTGDELLKIPIIFKRQGEVTMPEGHVH